jgi:lysozyme family protein
MPVQTRLGRTAPPAPQAQPASGAAQLGAQARVGNAGMVERLLGGGGGGTIASLRGLFPDLETADPSTAPASVLSAAVVTDGGAPQVAADGPDAGGQGTTTPGGATAETSTVASTSGPSSTPAVATGPSSGTVPPAPTKVKPVAGTPAATMYAGHAGKVGTLSSRMTPAQAEDLEAFRANWKANKGRYEAVSAKAGVPAALVAAIHWRESTGNFQTYLHQGDPLGKKATHVPTNIPVFTVWEDAAVHALTMSDKKQVHDDLGMDEDTRDGAAMATYAEFYNGTGYDQRGKASPYVYSGTNGYQKGKYTSDHHFSPNVKDQQLGVMAMVGSIGGMDETIEAQPASGKTGWDSVLAGRTMRSGTRGPLVKELQDRLAAAGFPCGSDKVFGPAVEKAVKAFQTATGLDPDGIVGKDVAAKLVGAAGAATPGAATPGASTPGLPGTGAAGTGVKAAGPAGTGVKAAGPGAPAHQAVR